MPPTPIDLDTAGVAKAELRPDDDRGVTLWDGQAQLPLDAAHYEVWLGPVGYTSLQAYRSTGTGALEQIGPSRRLDDVHRASANGASPTVDRNVYGADGARCCPSAGVREEWRFDGLEFVLAGSTPIPPPGAGTS